MSGIPRKSLSIIDGIAVLVGIVVVTGIFGFPLLVAQRTDNAWIYPGLLAADGFIALTGALCYGDYTGKR